MRLIDADALKYALGSSDSDIYFGALIDEMPTIESAPVWTPCDKWLPEPEPYYAKAEKLFMVNYTWGNDTILTAIASYREMRHRETKDTVWYDEGRKEDMIQNMSGSGRTVIAWRPLPAPYNPDKAQEARADG